MYSEKEIGRMTYSKFFRLYNQYKKYYDFKLSNKSYRELDEIACHDGEFLPDWEEG